MTATARKRDALASGTRVARRLQLERKLGVGGMGVVWSAHNLTTKAEIAVKVLHPEQQERLHAAERFRHEARLGATLAHRNITRVFDLIEDEDGTLFLLMELLRGRTLRTYLEANGPLSNEAAVAVVLPILSALAHAHDHGVVHRDIKPSNIFLHVEPDGRVIPKLIDFGIAKTDGNDIETRTGDALGTPSYMSPEQVRAKDKLDGRSDLFSIGVLLYEIIAGTNPFRAQATSGTLARILEEEVDPDPRIDPRLWVEIKRVLSKRAYERHANARELRTALCAALEKSETLLVDDLKLDVPFDPFVVNVALPTFSQPLVTAPRRTRTKVFAAVAVTVVVTVTTLGIRAALAPAPSPATTLTSPIAPPPIATQAEVSPLTEPTSPPPPPPTTQPVAATQPLATTRGTPAAHRSPAKPAPSLTPVARKPGF